MNSSKRSRRGAPPCTHVCCRAPELQQGGGARAGAPAQERNAAAGVRPRCGSNGRSRGVSGACTGCLCGWAGVVAGTQRALGRVQGAGVLREYTEIKMRGSYHGSILGRVGR